MAFCSGYIRYTLDDEIIVKDVRSAVRKAISAAYRLGRNPKDANAKYVAEKAFDSALREATRCVSRARDNANMTGYHGRLRVLRDAVSRPEADPANPDHAVWLAAVRFFAEELGMPFPPSAREYERSRDPTWAKELTSSQNR